MTAGADDEGERVMRAARVAVADYLRQHPATAQQYDDMLSDACLGAWTAALRWRPDRGAAWWTFVYRRALGAVEDGVRQRSPVSRREHQRGVTVHDLPPHRRDPLPLGPAVDEPHRDFVGPLLDRLQLEQLLDGCSVVERAVLVATVVQGHTLAQVAAQWGFTESWACHVRRRALARLRALHDGGEAA